MASGTWIGPNAGGSWNVGANWSSGTVPNGLADVATFNAGVVNVDIATASVTLGGIVCNAANLQIYTSGGFGINLANPTTMNVSGANTLDIGVVMVGALRSLVKTGTGTLDLRNVNIYTGATTLNAGILRVVQGGLGSGTTFTFGATGTSLVYLDTVNDETNAGRTFNFSGLNGTFNITSINGRTYYIPAVANAATADINCDSFAAGTVYFRSTIGAGAYRSLTVSNSQSAGVDRGGEPSGNVTVTTSGTGVVFFGAGSYVCGLRDTSVGASGAQFGLSC